MEYEEVLQEMRTVMVLDSWIDEQKEDSITREARGRARRPAQGGR